MSLRQQGRIQEGWIGWLATPLQGHLSLKLGKGTILSLRQFLSPMVPILLSQVSNPPSPSPPLKILDLTLDRQERDYSACSLVISNLLGTWERARDNEGSR